MAAKKMQDLFEEELQDVYSAEQQITKALPKMAEAASAPELKEAFKTHLDETKEQIARLDQIFQQMGIKAGAKECKAMKGLVEEGQEIMQEGLAPEVLDAALIMAAQKVEHYEIASYGSLRAYAEACGLDQVANLLNETLREEKATDETLNDLAVSNVNPRAIEKSAA